MRISDKKAFALSVVQSSDSKLSVEQKIDLYIEALRKAQSYNDRHPNEKATVKSFPNY